MKIGLKILLSVLCAAAYIALLILMPFSWLTFLPGLLVCSWLATWIHETGHLAAYAMLKLTWKRMVVSCFVLDREKGLFFDTSRSLFAGSCTCAYSPEIPLWRYDLALLSGGFLGVIFGAAALWLSFLTGAGLQAFFQCFSLVNLLHAAVNLLLPISADRKMMLQLRKKSI